MISRLTLRKDTLTNFTTHNPILSKGELAVVYNDDAKTFLYVAIGNGESNFLNLPKLQCTPENVVLITDIVDNLTTQDAEKPLSANQGKVLDEKKQNKQDDTLKTTAKEIVGSINEIFDLVNDISDPYQINLTDLLAASESSQISTAIGGIDNLNNVVSENRVIVGTLASGSVAVSIRVLGNVTTLYYFVDTVLGLTINEIHITNTNGTLSKTVNTHEVLTEALIIDNLTSTETTLPLSANQGKVLDEKKQDKTDNTLQTTAKTVSGAINELFQKKQNKLTPGNGISIEGDTISTTLDISVFKVVSVLPDQPEEGNEGKIYVVPNEEGQGQDVYSEYIWADGKWELLGEFKPQMDLTPYLLKTEAETTYVKKADALVIDGGAADTVYE